MLPRAPVVRVAVPLPPLAVAEVRAAEVLPRAVVRMGAVPPPAVAAVRAAGALPQVAAGVKVVVGAKAAVAGMAAVGMEVAGTEVVGAETLS